MNTKMEKRLPTPEARSLNISGPLATPPTTRESPASGSKPKAKGNNQNDKGKKKITFSLPSTPPNNMDKCTKCSRAFTKPASLALHIKTCTTGENERRKCNWCSQSFPSFASVRQHERRKHPAEYNVDLEQKLPAPDDEIYRKIAEIEASCAKGTPFLKKMAKAVNLTEHQVRSRREKPKYARFLAKAKENIRNSNKILIPPKTTASAPIPGQPETPLPQSTGPKTYAEQVKSPPRADEPATEREPPMTPPQTSPPQPDTSSLVSPPIGAISSSPGFHDSQVPGPSAKRQITPPIAPPSKRHNTPQRRAATPSIIPPADASHAETVNSRKRPRRSLSDARQPKKPLWLQAHFDDFTSTDEGLAIKSVLMTLRPKAEGSDVLRRIIDAAVTDAPDLLQEAIDRWTPSATKPTKRKTPSKPPHQYGSTHGPSNKKASQYKKTQDLYSKNKRSLAEKILSGRPLEENQVLPDINKVEELYRGILESPNNTKSLDTVTVTAQTTNGSTVHPITPEEIEKAKEGWSNSAPGSDNITVAAVKSADNHQLAIVYNAILLTSVTPSTWKTLRTTLIPKEGDLSDPTNWRPITIGCTGQRLYHRILTKRLKHATNLNNNQRGFIEADGALTNVLLLDTFSKDKRSKTQPHTVIAIDVRKAFDTVSHPAIANALKRAGIESHLINYINKDLSTSSTTIKIGNQYTNPIRIQRGVKQGDPLSPTLFNLVLDELLDAHTNSPDSATIVEDDFKCPMIAFADDLIIMANCENSAKRLLDATNSFLKDKGMAINSRKCKCLSTIAHSRKLITRTKPIYNINGTDIPMVQAISPFRYLGHQYGLAGLAKPSLAELPGWLHNTHKAALKPDQKLSIVRDHIVPRLLYATQVPTITAKVLKDADRLIRLWLKRMLHLNIHTPDAAIHARLRDGGLGIIELRSTIPTTLLRRLIKIRENANDTTGQRLTYLEPVEKLMTKLSNLAEDVDPNNHWRQKISSGPFTSGLEDASYSSASRSWITNKPRGWSGRDFVRAIQTRTANLPTAAIPSNPPEQQNCRAGCNKKETLCHVLQGCPVTHWPRIRRHNEIAKKIASHCRSKEWAVEEEPHIRHPDGTLFKPDLLVHQGNDIIVADVQVCWEGEITLGQAHERKRGVYQNNKFCEALRRLHPNKTPRFEPITLGARGIWPRANEAVTQTLKLTPQLMASCVHSTLKWASTIHNEFGRSVWRRR